MKIRAGLIGAVVSVVLGFMAVGSASAAGPNDVTCGEKAQISVTITDSAGQPVSDHTAVEFVTNYGGVIAGADTSLAGGQIAPLSSGTAETFNGVATVYLLTSTEHAGAYEVVVSAGGSSAGSWPNGSYLLPYGAAMRGWASLSTPPVTTQVTVTCHLAAS
jgi:hypothetical protein